MIKYLSIGLISSLLLFGSVLTGCYYDVEEELYPGTGSAGPCDTINLSYAASIAPIMQQFCVNCHGAGNGTGTELTNYTQVSANAAAVLNSVTRTSNTMPKGGNRLSDCNISRIRAWISQGKQP